ncbi:hypothetical protein ACFRNT_38385 [Streptomyces sp. NPDC056697]|uniref:hypothetical protein n=1 Tax=unclassified Streptomyces TaxID=2593676 RepID=UPI0033D7D788
MTDEVALRPALRASAALPVLAGGPDAAAPSIRRLETDSALLEEALETGRRAIMAQFAPAARS